MSPGTCQRGKIERVTRQRIRTLPSSSTSSSSRCNAVSPVFFPDSLEGERKALFTAINHELAPFFPIAKHQEMDQRT